MILLRAYLKKIMVGFLKKNVIKITITLIYYPAVKFLASTFCYRHWDASFWIAPHAAQQDAVLALVQSHWGVLDREGERRLMLGYLSPLGGNRSFTVCQEEGERGTRVGSRPGAEQVPHICLLLKNEVGHRQIAWKKQASVPTRHLADGGSSPNIITQKEKIGLVKSHQEHSHLLRWFQSHCWRLS